MPAFFLVQWADSSGKLVEYTIKHGRLIAKPVGPRATGFEPHLYSFPDLPPDATCFLEAVFFDYADRVAAEALRNHLSAAPVRWTSELTSAWSRFVIAIHLRHPDAMPELRAAAKSVWEGSSEEYQARYEAIKRAEDPATLDEYLATRDPLTATKIGVNMIIRVFDNEILGKHLNNMTWGVIDVGRSPYRFLLSDRAVSFANRTNADGSACLPISPTRLFVAANTLDRLQRLRALSPCDIVHNSNRFLVGRARRFVWAHDRSQGDFIAKHMSQRMEKTPLFPNIGFNR
ncbi:hypothetical protein AS156_36100 [Bradyrhizobium macuxiense]|uniref:DUF4238 domain-containing protein n=1 Tax=Bradyrhizobium macuxiense TaxID=1755647 RepID=A0A109JZX1_9BRAD|nr:DUF4238 domain-containing protein [Bradyrhizobium macuxiense]KWV58223.1 hypothetical protein AS156_36100 [Bradyrhizobium macuxiense]